MIKRLVLLVLILGLSNLVFGQSDTIQKSKRNAIFIAPMNIFDVINPSFQLGYERVFNDKISAQIEGGVVLRHSVLGFIFEALNRGAYWYTNSGYKIRFEIKYSINNKIRFLENPYLSCELFYTKNKSYVNDLFIVKDTTYVYPIERPSGYNGYEDFFTLDKQRFGINLKIGTQIFLTEHVFFEPHIGLGIVYRKSKHYGRMNINDDFYDKVLSFHNEKGDMIIPNFPCNVKIGYKF